MSKLKHRESQSHTASQWQNLAPKSKPLTTVPSSVSPLILLTFQFVDIFKVHLKENFSVPVPLSSEIEWWKNMDNTLAWGSFPSSATGLSVWLLESPFCSLELSFNSLISKLSSALRCDVLWSHLILRSQKSSWIITTLYLSPNDSFPFLEDIDIF